jgi:hypothetical protein
LFKEVRHFLRRVSYRSNGMPESNLAVEAGSQ